MQCAHCLLCLTNLQLHHCSTSISGLQQPWPLLPCAAEGRSDGQPELTRCAESLRLDNCFYNFLFQSCLEGWEEPWFCLFLFPAGLFSEQTHLRLAFNSPHWGVRRWAELYCWECVRQAFNHIQVRLVWSKNTCALFLGGYLQLALFHIRLSLVKLSHCNVIAIAMVYVT